MTGRGSGELVTFNEGRGYGFIKRDDGQSDLFLHVKAMRHHVDGRLLAPGVRVAYHVTNGPRGEAAADVELLA